MPKLDNTHLANRIKRQIERLKSDQSLIVRDIKAVLSPEQFAAAEAMWAQQKQLHRGKRPRSDEERKELGMKDKRDIYIEALEVALAEANSSTADFLEEAQLATTKRQTAIYVNAISDAVKDGKRPDVARNYANNELTRAGLNRLDRARTEDTKRDREVKEMEETLLARLRDERSDEEKEHERLLEEQMNWKPPKTK